MFRLKIGQHLDTPTLEIGLEISQKLLLRQGFSISRYLASILYSCSILKIVATLPLSLKWKLQNGDITFPCLMAWLGMSIRFVGLNSPWLGSSLLFRHQLELESNHRGQLLLLAILARVLKCLQLWCELV